MEIDELKKSWGKQKNDENLISPEKLAGIIRKNIDTEGRSIRNRFIGEIIAVVFIYSAVIFYVLNIRKNLNELFYIFISLSLISILPVIIKFVKSISYFKHLDYSLDIRHSLENSLAYFKSTLNFYKWSVYFVSFIVIIILSFNVYQFSYGFITLAGIILYIIIVGLLTKPYLKWLYGKQVQNIEKTLRELNQ